MLHGKSARVKGILDRALGPVVQIPDATQPLGSPAKLSVSKYSLKFFSRDDSMYSKPESIRASVDNEVRKLKLKERRVLEEHKKAQLRQQVGRREVIGGQRSGPSHKATDSTNNWILKDDLD